MESFMASLGCRRRGIPRPLTWFVFYYVPSRMHRHTPLTNQKQCKGDERNGTFDGNGMKDHLLWFFLTPLIGFSNIFLEVATSSQRSLFVYANFRCLNHASYNQPPTQSLLWECKGRSFKKQKKNIVFISCFSPLLHDVERFWSFYDTRGSQYQILVSWCCY